MAVMGFVVLGVAAVLFVALVVLMLILMHYVHRARVRASDQKLFSGETANATLLAAITVVILCMTGISGGITADSGEVVFLVFSVIGVVASLAGFGICVIGYTHLRRQCWDVMHRRTGNIVLPR